MPTLSENTCKLRPPRVHTLAVECPTCHAMVGKWCFDRYGMRPYAPHEERIGKAAIRAVELMSQKDVTASDDK